MQWSVGAGVVFALAACVGVSATAQSGPSIATWLDVDTAMGPVVDRPRDVDDGLTLIQALATPELRVVGVSAVFGNAPLADAVANTQRIVDRFAKSKLPVFAGAAAASDLGRETAATRALASALEREPLAVLALGPATTVATVVASRPDLRARIRQIVLVAARRPGFDFHPVGRPELKFPDANFEKDVPAMQVLLDSGVPLVFAGYEASSDVWLMRSHLEAVAAAGPNGAWIMDQSRAWLERWERVQKLKGFNPFDTHAVGWLVHPSWFTSVAVRTHITTGPDDRLGDGPPAGRTTKAYLVSEPSDKPTASQVYLTGVGPAFVPWLVERLSAR